MDIENSPIVQATTRLGDNSLIILEDPVPSTFNNSQTSAQEQLAQVQGELEIVNEKMNRAIDQLERELQCGICREVIVFAVSLNCMHTFCHHCIHTWKANRMECPVCRTPIRSEGRNCMIDSTINTMTTFLPEEAQLLRRELIQQRQLLLDVVVQFNPTSLNIDPLDYANRELRRALSELLAFEGDIRRLSQVQPPTPQAPVVALPLVPSPPSEIIPPTARVVVPPNIVAVPPPQTRTAVVPSVRRPSVRSNESIRRSGNSRPPWRL